jgi:hypothetical protein
MFIFGLSAIGFQLSAKQQSNTRSVSASGTCLRFVLRAAIQIEPCSVG